MIRHHRFSPVYTILTWMLVALMVEPQTRVVGQESSTYIRALEVLLAPTPSRGPAQPAPILLAQAQSPLPLQGERAGVRADIPSLSISSAAATGNAGSSVTDTNFLLGLTRTPITLTNGNQLLSLSFFSDSNHNYVVEFRDELGLDLCNDWQPLTNAPHNYGIVFTDNQVSNRFFRLRRIDVPRSPLFALLANDTGTNSLDGITSDPTITGLALNFPAGTLLQASLDNGSGPFTTLTNLGAPRYFVSTREQLAAIQGGTLSDGPHVLHLRAEPAAGNPPFDTRNSTFALPFTLDTTPPSVSIRLADGFDSAPLGDGRTTFNPVTLIGQTEPGARLELLAAASPSPGGEGRGEGGLFIYQIQPDANGSFALTNVVLAEGTNRFFFRALDAACNETNSLTQICWFGPNCSFPDNLEGWTVNVGQASSLSPIASPVPGSVVAATDKSCAAVMTEGDSFLVTLSREFIIPTLPSVLTFTYEASFDTTSANLMRDAFEAALVDAAGRPLTFTIQGTNAVTPASVATPAVLPPSPDAFFNHTDGNALFNAPGVARWGLLNAPRISTISVDVSHLPPGSAARLILRLVNNDRDRATTVRITDVQLKLIDPSMNYGGSPPTALSLIGGGENIQGGSASDCAPGGSRFVGTDAPASARTVGGNVTTNSPVPTPTLTVLAPADSQSLPVGTSLLSGLVMAQEFAVSTNVQSVPNRIVLVTVNGAPVDALDAAGNFFSTVAVRSGQNVFNVIATDAFNLSTTNTVTVYGETCPQNFASLGEVSTSVQPEYGRTSFNEWTKVLYADLALRNAGTYPIRAPFYVGVTRIGDPSVRLLAPDGVSADGIPYYDYSAAPANGALDIGHSSLARSLAFHNPNRVQFTYDLVILAQLNRAPVITTVPVLEAMAGHPYAYAIAATDPDGDTLTFSLVSAPTGMTLTNAPPSPGGEGRGEGEQGSTLNWQPSTSDLGTHSIRLRVADGHGGSAEQRYVLSVVVPSPNRPPVISSVPVTTVNPGKLSIGGRIFVANDEWALTQPAFDQAPTLTNFALNLSAWFLEGTDKRTGRFHGFAVHDGFAFPSLYGTSFISALTNAGHIWTEEEQAPFTLESLLNYDAVFLGSIVPGLPNGLPDTDVLVNYVNRGGNVYLAGGSFSFSGSAVAEAAAWNPFLRPFGIEFTNQFNAVNTIVPVTNNHPVLDGFRSFLNGHGQNITILAPDDVRTTVLVSYQGQNLSAIYDPRATHPVPYLYDVEATDPDGDSLSYRLVTSPPGMWIGAASGRIWWSPSFAQIGTHAITVQVSDGHGGLDTQSYLVRVLADPTNSPPLIISQPITVAFSGQEYHYDVDAIDPDNDILTYSLISGSPGMTLDPSSGLIRWRSPDHANTNLPFAPGFDVSIYAGITNPAGLAFVPDGTLFVGSDQGELPIADPSSEIRRILPGGGSAQDYSRDILADPDALTVDVSGAIAGQAMGFPQPGGVLVGGLSTGFGNVSRITLIRTNGESKVLFGDTTAFINPNKLLIDRLGRLLFSAVSTSSGYNTGAVFASTGSFPQELFRANYATASFALDSENRIFTLVRDSRGTSDLGDDQLRIQINSFDGTLINSNFAGGIELPGRDATTGYFGGTALAIDPSPECHPFSLYLLHNSRLYHFDEAGRKTIIGTDFKGQAVDMVFGPDRSLYVSMGNGRNQILRLEPMPSVAVAVEDGRGGVDTQCYQLLVEVETANLQGEIRGTVFNDLDGDGLRGAGDLLVTSQDTDAILRYSGKTGAFLGEFISSGAGGLTKPNAIIVGPDGLIYINSFFGANKVWRFDRLTGAFVDEFVSEGSGGLNVGTGMRFGPDGNLYVASHLTESVIRYNGRTGAWMDAFVPSGSGGLIRPSGIVFGADGHLYVGGCDRSEILRYDGSSGAFLGVFVPSGSGGLACPQGLRFGPDGNLYTPSVFTANVLRYNGQTGDFMGVFVTAPELLRPADVLFGLDGKLYVDSQTLASVLRFDAVSGAYLDTFVPPGSGGLDRATSMLFTSEPDLPGWTIYIDQNNNHKLDPSERSATSDVNGNYAFTNITAGTHIIREEEQFGWIISSPRSGFYSVTVTNGQVVGGIDFGNQRKPPVTTNQSPAFVSNAPTNATVATTFRYDVVATDPDLDRLLYTLLVGPPGMVLEPSSGVLVWIPQPGQIGLHSVILRVQDGLGGTAIQSFRIEVVEENHPPSITSHPTGPAVLGRPWQYQMEAQDADGDPISFRLIEGPGGMSLTNGQQVTWTPGFLQTGLVHVAVSASDGRSSTTQSFELPVVAIASNRPPQIASQPRSVVRIGDVFSFVVEMADPDGDPVTLRLTNSPPGMALTNPQPASANTRLVQWQPAALGTNSYELVVSDGRIGVTYRYQITVASQITNSAPQIVSRPLATAIVGAGYAYDPAAQDADNDRLGWYLDSAPAGMSIDPASGSIRWTPTLSQLGTNRVVLQVIDGQGGFTSQTFDVVVRPVNLAPQFVSSPTTLAETNVLYQYQVRISDVENDSLTFSLATAPVGMGFVFSNPDNSLGTNSTFSTDGDFALLRWVPSAAQLGTNRVVILVQDQGGGLASQEFNVVVTTNQNSKPVITSSPALFGATNIQYQYQIAATDPDGDTLTFALLNGPSGMVLNSNSGLVQWTPSQVGSYPVSVSARDSQSAASSQSFVLNVTDANRPPVLAIPGARTFTWATLAYTFTAQATDPDDDSIAFSISGPASMTIRPSGQVDWLPGVSDEGSHRITVTATDARGLASSLQFDLRVGVDRQPPFLQLGCDPTPLPVGSILDIAAFPRDNFGPPTLEVTVDGKPVALDAQNRGEAVFERTGVIPVVARATDFFGNSTTSTCFYTIYDQGFGSLPFVEILSPESDALVTGSSDIFGTVADTNLVSFALSVRPLDGGEFTQIGRGTNVVLTNVLGRLDTTLLANGSYVLRLEAFDSDGLSNSAESTFTVAGELKVGNFRLSFVDLSIPVNGIPVTVARSYDTLQARERGDFGYGWRLEFRDSRLRTSLPPRTPEEIETGLYQRFTDRTRVAVTLPGGKREVFTFKPAPALGPGFQAALGALAPYRPAFEPLRGATARLSVPSNLGPGQSIVLRRNFNGGWDAATGGGTGSLPYNPDDPALGGVYLVQTREGLGYEIEPETGFLRRAGDANGNTLEFSNNGVTNTTSGVGVSFIRNPRGLITAVTDLMGRQIRYDYDAIDNLIAVTDRDTNTTHFVYSTNAAQSHYLVRIIDPLGRTGVRVNFDEQGRMTNLVDAANNAVQLVHDVDNSIERVVDALGHTNTFHYDEFGNVVKEVNALGGVTLREYDVNFFMTVEVDALGNTNRFRYDDQGNVLERTDPLGNVSHNNYTDVSGGFFAIRNGLPPYQRRLTATIDPLGNTTQNQYDPTGALTATTDAKGNTTRYSYDGAGNQTSITDAAGNVTRFEYDQRGNLLRQTDVNGNTTAFEYDPSGNQLAQVSLVDGRFLTNRTEYSAGGRPTAVTDALGHTTRTTYDALGNTAATTDALGHTNRFLYDDRGQLLSTVFADGTSNRIAYDAAGRRTNSTDRAGRTTSYEYDVLGRLVSTTYPDGARTRTVYDLAGRVIAQVDERTNRTAFAYDPDGRQIAVTNALGSATRSEYDSAGRKTTDIDPLGRTTRFVYDELGRRIHTLFTDGTTNTTVYDSLGRVAVEVDQAGVSNAFGYDSLGRLTSVTNALGTANQTVTVYAYNEAGNLTRQQDALNRVTRYEYDGLGRRVASVLPLGQRSGTLYNPVGNVAAVTNFNRDVIRFDYDANNRLTAKSLPDGTTIHYAYTLTGRRAAITNGTNVTLWTYDARDRLISRTDPDGRGVAYAYDLAGNRTALFTTSNGQQTTNSTTRFTFDALNRLETVTDPDGGVARYTYDPANNVQRVALPNGTFRTNAYDALNRVTSIAHLAPTGVFSSFRYTLGPTGHRLAVQENTGRQVRYDYDALSRLVRESVFNDPSGPNPTNSFGYDAVGNRLYFTNSLEGVTAYDYDANDQLLTETLSEISNPGFPMVTAYAYDANGNTLSRSNATQSTAYSWDAQNRMVGARIANLLTSAATNLSYQYDDDGIRVAAFVDGDETRYLIDANRPFAQVVEEWTSINHQPPALTASYTHGPHHLISQSRAGAPSWYHADGLGSTRALTGQSGSPTDRYQFDAYGRTLAQSGPTDNAYLFAGEQRDRDLGLDYLRARYLNFNAGRFYGRDSFEAPLRLPNLRHLFAYVSGDPVNVTDPSGQIRLEIAVGFTAYNALILPPSLRPGRPFADIGLFGGKREIKWTGTLTQFGLSYPTPLLGGFLSVSGARLRLEVESECTLFEGHRQKLKGAWSITEFGVVVSPPKLPLYNDTSTTVTIFTPAFRGLNPNVLSGPFAWLGATFSPQLPDPSGFTQSLPTFGISGFLIGFGGRGYTFGDTPGFDISILEGFVGWSFLETSFGPSPCP